MDELLGRKTPHSAVAEQAVIGSMLIDARCIADVLEKLRAEEEQEFLRMAKLDEDNENIYSEG